MLDVSQFRQFVVRPALKLLEPHIMWSEAAEEILIGTSMQESRLTYLVQHGGGPARGVFQIEPDTLNDVYKNFLHFRPDLERRVTNTAGRGAILNDELITNLVYATVIARLIYFRAPGLLPASTDIEGMAAYYKKYYNTPLGKATAEEWAEKYKEYVLGL